MFPLPNRFRIAALFLALPLVLFTGCTAAEDMTRNPGRFTSVAPCLEGKAEVIRETTTSTVPCLEGKAEVALETTKGRFTVEVDGGAAPLTSGNFVDLVRRGIYDGTIFHRVIPGFVAQGGDPASAVATTPKEQYGTGNFIDPDTGQSRFIPLEISLTGEDHPRYDELVAEPGISGRLKLRHAPGALAMARSQEPNSASAQFYVALEAQPALDGSYAVFGTVIQGMDVVRTLENGDQLIRAKVMGLH